jgi:hypothetical protein
MEAVDRLARLWELGDGENRQELVRSLFENTSFTPWMQNGLLISD